MYLSLSSIYRWCLPTPAKPVALSEHLRMCFRRRTRTVSETYSDVSPLSHSHTPSPRPSPLFLPRPLLKLLSRSVYSRFWSRSSCVPPLPQQALRRYRCLTMTACPPASWPLRRGKALIGRSCSLWTVPVPCRWGRIYRLRASRAWRSPRRIRLQSRNRRSRRRWRRNEGRFGVACALGCGTGTRRSAEGGLLPGTEPVAVETVGAPRRHLTEPMLNRKRIGFSGKFVSVVVVWGWWRSNGSDLSLKICGLGFGTAVMESRLWTFFFLPLPSPSSSPTLVSLFYRTWSWTCTRG